jgi:hypothetical protein
MKNLHHGGANLPKRISPGLARVVATGKGDGEMIELENILDSRIKKVRIELPHYSFSHSSSGESSHTSFVGRKKIQEKLTKLIEATTDETGVYLVTGNRGVGKTRLVSQVINQTSLEHNSDFFENIKYLFYLLFPVVITQFCLQKFTDITSFWKGCVCAIICALGSFILGRFSCYRHKIYKQNISFLEIFKSAFKELFTSINPYNQYRLAQYILKIILAVSLTQFLSAILCVTPTIAFIFYSVIVLGYMLFLFGIGRWKEYYHKYEKEELSKCDIICKCFIQVIIYEILLIPIRKYIKNHRRLYLRINFGHKLKDEKDILRLIARTLNTEYHEYLRLLKRMLPWRVMAFGFLFLFAYLFSTLIEEQEFYKSIKKSPLYRASSQVHLNNSISKDSTYLEVKNFIYVKKDSIHAKRDSSGLEIKVSSNNSIYLKAEDSIHIKKNKECLEYVFANGNCSFNKIETFLLALDDIVFEISKRVVKFPQYLWEGRRGKIEENKIEDNKNIVRKFISPVDYLFWLSFFTMYLFCILIFRCSWITHFFVTNRIIKQQLKKLNSDITYSTELENSVNIKSESIGIGTKTKKSRGIADAREIEKELQDILKNVQRIPAFMCRPNIVIVFDELDKVEPSENSLENEKQKTKASLFSIDAARERQTEILKILSNMKYFLSTVNAKFIFIAGREMYDIYLADVSERNNYIGSIFNAVIYVPSFLTDPDRNLDITSSIEEFVCRRLIPNYYLVESYNLKNYRDYLEKYIYNDNDAEEETKQKIQKIIAVLQQFIVYLSHLSKGAPKKMIQLFESFIEVCEIDENEEGKFLVVQRYHNSKLFLTFNYYKQYTIGIIAYLITPIFYRLAESNIKKHSDKLLVSSLRFIDFLFKFHKHPFSWKHLDISPEMLEVNRSPALKSVTMDLLNYLTQVHITRSNFSFSDYTFDNSIADEIFAMTKMDNVFSALFSFSLDEMLPLKKHYQDLLEETQKEYQNDINSPKFYLNHKGSPKFIDAVSSLQVVLGDLHYYDDELEEAGVYYKNAVQVLSNLKPKNENNEGKEDETMTLEQHYLYLRNMLRLGMIYERRKQYDFAYLTYGEICKRIIRERGILSNMNDVLFKKMTYEGLKMLYLPFIAKLQILEKSHMGGIAPNHLIQLEKDFTFMTNIDIDHKEAKFLETEFYSRLADILYYKNSDLRSEKKKDQKKDKDIKNYSCTACYYYRKALSILLGLNKDKITVKELLSASVERINDNYDMKYCTILARILSDWGNVFFSCDAFLCGNKRKNKKYEKDGYECYICDAKDCNTRRAYFHANLETLLEKYINYVESEEKNKQALLNAFDSGYDFSKMEIAFAMYAISSKAYTKSNLHKRSSYQIFKMLRLFKYYEIYDCDYIIRLSQKAIRSLWQANEELNIFEINKRKKDFDKHKIEERIPLPNILIDSEINRIMVLVKYLELKSDKTTKRLKEYYGQYITSPYEINYSILARIYQLRLKATVNYEAYQMFIYNKNYENEREKFWDENYDKEKNNKEETEIKFILEKEYCDSTIKAIFKEYLKYDNVDKKMKVYLLEKLIAETIFCFKEIIHLSETIGETYLFNHLFIGSIHEKLSFWIRLYELYEKKYKKEDESRIDVYFKKYLGEGWREQLSGYYENQQALSHYYKCLETHNEGRAYHNMIDNMCYLKDDYNDRSDHFNIAEERHYILNKGIKEKIEELEELEELYKDSGLYDADNYLYKKDYC